MGFNVGSGSVTISADTRQFEAALTRVHRQLQSLTGSAGGFSAVGVGAAAATAAIAGLALVAAKVASAVSGLADSAIGFESRLSQVRKTTGLAGADLAKFQDKIEGIATSMAGARLDELLDIGIMGGRLGVASNKIEQFTRDIEMLKIALDDIPAEEIATSIGRILNVFQMGTENAIRFGSALNKLDDTSTATGRDILDISRRISGPAAVLGLSPQKVLALAATLKDAGATNEVAGTAMSQVFAKMAVDSRKFAIVAGVTGEAFKKMLGRDPLEALQAFIKGFSKLDAVTQFQVLDSMKLKGARVQTTLLQLSRVMDKLGTYVKTANDEWATMASITKEVEIQGQTTTAQLTRMWNAVEILKVKIGNALLPLIKALANSFTDLALTTKDIWKGVEGEVAKWLAPAVKWADRLSVAFTHWKDLLALAGLAFYERLLKAGMVIFSFLETVQVAITEAIANGIMNGFKAIPANVQGVLFGGAIGGGAGAGGAIGGQIAKWFPNWFGGGVQAANAGGAPGAGAAAGGAGNAAGAPGGGVGVAAAGFMGRFDAIMKQNAGMIEAHVAGMRGPIEKRVNDAVAAKKAEREAREKANMPGAGGGGAAGGAPASPKAALLDFMMRREHLSITRGRMGFEEWQKANPEFTARKRKEFEEQDKNLTDAQAQRALESRRRQFFGAPGLRGVNVQGGGRILDAELRQKQVLGLAAGLGMGPGIAGAAMGAIGRHMADEATKARKRIDELRPGRRGAGGPAGAIADGGRNGQQILEALGADKKKKQEVPKIMGLEEFLRETQEKNLKGAHNVDEDILSVDEEQLGELRLLRQMFERGINPGFAVE